MVTDDLEAENGKIDYAVEAFDKFVRSVPNSADHIVDAASGLTGEQLHLARQWMEDLSTDSTLR